MGKYDAWRSLFAQATRGEFSHSISELESMLGGKLPPSARQYQAWWSGHPHNVWESCGFKAMPDLRTGLVTFRRMDPLRRETTPSRPARVVKRPTFTREVREGPHLILVGCVKTKRRRPLPAKDLYDSPLWRGRRRYAEASGMPWAILSAEYGLVDPDTELEPYDRYLGNESASYRRDWAAKVSGELLARLEELRFKAVEIHAGSAYVNSGLATRLQSAGVSVTWPVEGMTIGQQLAWYR